MFTGLKIICGSYLSERKDTPRAAGCPLFLVLFCVLLLSACSPDKSGTGGGDIDIPAYEGDSENDKDADALENDGDTDAIEKEMEFCDSDCEAIENDEESDIDFVDVAEFDDDEIETEIEDENEVEDIAAPVCTPDLAYKYPGTWQYVYPNPYSTYSPTEVRKPVIKGPGGFTMASGGAGRFVYLEDGQWRLAPNYLYSEESLSGHPQQNATVPDGGPDSILDSGKVFTYREDGCWHADEALEAYPDIYEHRWVGDDLWAVQASERRILRKFPDGAVTEHPVDLYGDAFVYPTTITSCNGEPLAAGLAVGDYKQHVFLLEHDGDTWQPRFIGKINASEQAVPIEIFCNDSGITIVTENGEIFMSDAFPPDENWTSFSIIGPECVEDSLVTCSSMDEEGRAHIGLYSCEQNYQVFDGETQVFGLSPETQTEFEERLHGIIGLRATEEGLTTIAAQMGIMNISMQDGSYNFYPREYLAYDAPKSMNYNFQRLDRLSDGGLVAAMYFSPSGINLFDSLFYIIYYIDGCWQVSSKQTLMGVVVQDMVVLNNRVWWIGSRIVETSEDPNGEISGLFYYDDALNKWVERLEDEIGKNISVPFSLDKIDDDSAIILTSTCCQPSLMRMYRTNDGGLTWVDVSPVIFDDPDLGRGNWWGVWTLGEYLFGNPDAAYRLNADGNTTVIWKRSESDPDTRTAMAAFKLGDNKYAIFFYDEIAFGEPGDMATKPLPVIIYYKNQIGQLSSGDLIVSAPNKQAIISISTDLEIRVEFPQPKAQVDRYNRIIKVFQGEHGDDVYVSNNGGGAPELYHLYAEGGRLDPNRLKCSNYPPLDADGDEDSATEGDGEAQ